MCRKIRFDSVFAVLLLMLGTGFAEDVQQQEEVLDRKAARQVARLADQDLKAARQAHKRGDMPAVDEALQRYSERMMQVEERMRQGKVPPSERKDVSEVVAKATSRHTTVLENLLPQVPAQGRRGIERALEVSGRGNETALENLKRERERRGEPPETRRGRSQRQGPPESVGPPQRQGPGPGRGQGKPGARPGRP